MRIFATLCFAAIALCSMASQPLSWGDQGNGTYINPVLNADYSDPDVIRVDDKYYLVCSEFHFMGIPVLESEDLVNWRIIGRVYDDIDLPGWDRFEKYACGSWAPAIRYHDGLFYVYFCTPDEGLFMATAENPAGPWSPLHCVKAIKRWEDPCPFWDEDGKAYLGHSLKGAGPIIIHKMSADGKTLLDDGVTVYTGPVAEGTKIHKRDGYYYLSIPEGGVGEGWQTILRSKNIYGPYEKRVVIERGSTDINGPHQGALVDTPDGEEWFVHFQRTDELGRVMHLQPVVWKDGWPEIGVDIDRNGIGEPVRVWTKPSTKAASEPSYPATSDEFDSDKLGLQWQANHKFHYDNIDLKKRPGHLTLTAMKGDSLKNAPNTLVQKIMGYESEAVMKLDVSKMADGQRAGLAGMAHRNYGGGIEKSGNELWLYTEEGGKTAYHGSFKGKTIYIKAALNAKDNRHQFFYSADGKNFHKLGDEFKMRFGFWKGPHIGIFTYNPLDKGGEAVIDRFIYTYD